ncbi:SNF2 family N-terminal domain-containing protein [Lipomyces japonicus]|uniref:SNF2 family N-terminal domain-containing protein n=1 Tax=Lipomyces japonicus TaxID=56871 RepID=UPI0034CE19D0
MDLSDPTAKFKAQLYASNDRPSFGQSSQLRNPLASAGLRKPPKPASSTANSGPYKPISNLNSARSGVQGSAIFEDFLEPMSPGSAGWKGLGLTDLTKRQQHRPPSTNPRKYAFGEKGEYFLERQVLKPVVVPDSPVRVISEKKLMMGSTPTVLKRPTWDPKPKSEYISLSPIKFRLQKTENGILDIPNIPDGPRSKNFTERDYQHISSAEVAESLKGILCAPVNENNSSSGQTYSAADATIDGLTVKLLNHQIEGVKFLQKRENDDILNKGGLLCDDMGLGKTVQSIALILSHRMSKEPEKSLNSCKSTLVVAPLALINQWADEIKTKAPSLSVLVHHGPQRTKSEKDLKKYDVVISTYQIVSSENDSNGPLLSLDWWRIILDEAHTIKNKSAKSSMACCHLHGRNRWALTGTPLQNKIDELHSLFKFLKIEPLSDSSFWREKISQPISAGRGKLAMERLQVVLQQVMLRRTKDVLVANGMKLPKRTVHKITVRLSQGERVFYDQLEHKMANKMEDLIGLGGHKYMSVLLLLLRLRQACNHTSIVKGKVVADKDAVILPSPTKKTSTKYGSDDIDALTNLLDEMTVDSRECAICQLELTFEQARQGAQYCQGCVCSFVVQGIQSEQPSAKIQKLLFILNEEKDRKTIVFSQFTTMLDLIEPFLKKEKIIFARYDGSMNPKERVESLERLQKDPKVSVLLCSLKCGALGLNLTSASRVVLVDPWWNPMISEQAIDRVHRIGQTRDVDVYEVTVEKTVEERILKLQEQKRELARNVMGGQGKLSTTALTKDEILYLFNRQEK